MIKIVGLSEIVLQRAKELFGDANSNIKATICRSIDELTDE